MVGNAHGLNVLAADAAEAAGLIVADAAGGNPADLGGAATPSAMEGTLSRLAASDEVDAIITTFAAAHTDDVPGMLAALAAAADTVTTLPMVVVVVGVPEAPWYLGHRRAPVFALPEQAVRAGGHAARYAAWRREPLGRRPDLADVDTDRARELVTEACVGGGGWQPASVTAELLGCYGIPIPASPPVSGVDEVVAAAAHVGYPVTVKAVDPAIENKAQRGLVRLDLIDSRAVHEAYLAVAAALDDPRAPVVVQSMRSGGVALVAGAEPDPTLRALPEPAC